MAFFRGEEGSVSFDNGTGSVGAIASTTAWTLDTTKDTLECTAHGDTSRKYVGSLISGSGTVDLLYTATSGDDTAEIITDVLTAEDSGDAAFNLFLDTSGTKKLSFNGIITGTSFSSTVGDISTVSVSFVTNWCYYFCSLMPKGSYSAKQRKLAAVAPPRDKITAADLKKLRSKKKKKKK